MAYRSYEAVKAVQEWLETAKEAGSFDFEGTLKELDGTYNGMWDANTDRVFRKWLTTQPDGSSIDTMVEYELISAAEAVEVKQAMREFEAANAPRRAGLGWILGGLAALGLLAWAVTRKSVQPVVARRQSR